MKKSFLIAWGMLVFLMLFNSNSYAQNVGQASGSGNVLGLKVPKVEKFVRVTKEEGADVLKYAREDSPWRVDWMGEEEDEEGEMGLVQGDEAWSDKKVPSKYTAEKSVEYGGEVLLLLGEEGDFWKVFIHKSYSSELEEGYIRKSDAEMVSFQPLTADMVKAPNEKKLSPTVVKTEGRYKGLVIDVGSDEEWGEEWLDVGVLADGMIVSPESYVVVLVHDYEMGDVKEMKCVFDKKTGNVVMRYPDSMYMENEDGMGRWFDPAKLTDAQIEQMLQTLSLKKRARRVRCDCLIPEGNGERNVYYLKY